MLWRPTQKNTLEFEGENEKLVPLEPVKKCVG
jgi:hypothetical protein